MPQSGFTEIAPAAHITLAQFATLSQTALAPCD